MEVSSPAAQAVMPARLPGREMQSMPSPEGATRAAAAPDVRAPEPTAATPKTAEPVKNLKAQFEPDPDPNAVRQELDDAIRSANERLLERGRDVSLSIDQSTNSVVVTVKDKAGATVRQIPPEQSLQIARSVDRLTGILVDKQA